MKRPIVEKEKQVRGVVGGLYIVLKKFDYLSSFLEGFRERSESDTINAFFITMRKLRVRLPFHFESRGCLGVESKEIRKILNFSDIRKINGNHKEFVIAGKLLCKVGSDELAWAAQYLMGGKTHLYPSETKKATEIQKILKVT